ncbi:MAG: hypothetical protein AAB570_03080, partial [Patescibacteria group bacterium]
MTSEHSGIVLRERLLRELSLKLVRVFDTNEHEPNKDVCLVEDMQKRVRVLRSGERRDPAVFPDGLIGKHFVIPALYATSAEPIYELEEYLEGDLVVDADKTPSASFPSEEILDRIFAAFWEWQEVGKCAQLVSQETHFEKHLTSALVLISDDRHKSVINVFERHRAFFTDASYPSKWKFADDNLVLMNDGKLGYIDNARMGLRFWGYDMGWVYWPRWFRMGVDAWAEPASSIADFQAFLDHWYASKPPDGVLDYSTFYFWAHLGLFTRLIGAFYDVKEHISHAENWLDTNNKRTVFLEFISNL